MPLKDDSATSFRHVRCLPSRPYLINSGTFYLEKNYTGTTLYIDVVDQVNMIKEYVWAGPSTTTIIVVEQ
jgi:hypothetical protein